MTALRVMTWNVENLFLPAEEGGTDDESVFQRKLAALAAVIDQEAPTCWRCKRSAPRAR